MDIVVCGSARKSCTVGIGDWNAPVSKQAFCNYTVADRWGQLVGGGITHGVPDELTCCYPDKPNL